MADWWKIGGAMAAQDAANQARRTARRSKQTNKLLEEQNRLLSMTEAERIAERQAKEVQAKRSENKWTLIGGLILLVGACIAFPVFGVIVVIIVVGVVVYLIVVHRKSNKEYMKSRSTPMKSGRRKK